MLLDRIETSLGYALSLVVWIMAIALTVVVILRYGFGIGATSLSELSTYALVTICMLGMSQTYALDRQVRLDVFYSQMRPLHKDYVNVIGNVLLLLPLCIFFIAYCFEYVSRSWQLLEGSSEAAGLPALYLIKTLLLIGPALLLMRTLLQSIALLQKILLPRNLEK